MVAYGLEQGESKVWHEKLLGFFSDRWFILLTFIDQWVITVEGHTRIYCNGGFGLLLSSITQGAASLQGLTGFLLLIRPPGGLPYLRHPDQSSKIQNTLFGFVQSVTNLITYCSEEIEIRRTNVLCDIKWNQNSLKCLSYPFH